MEITFLNRTNQNIDEFESLFHRIAIVAEKELGLKQHLEISVTFVRSRTIHQINLQYRGIDRPTDVISFAINDGNDGSEMSEELSDLGDIFINIDYARKQARHYCHSYEREMGFLFIHGLLHCLGYDHQTKAQEEKMFQIQQDILDPIVSRK